MNSIYFETRAKFVERVSASPPWGTLYPKRSGVVDGRGVFHAGFIVDFYCHKADLVIEVDGDIHDLQKEEEILRENTLKELGLKVIRFRNEQVLNNLPSVVKKIKEHLLA